LFFEKYEEERRFSLVVKITTMKMTIDKKKLDDFSINRRVFKIYWKGFDPYCECVCTKHKFDKPFRWLRYKKRRELRPYHNKSGNCRYGNSHKSWKNYRKTQYRLV